MPSTRRGLRLLLAVLAGTALPPFLIGLITGMERLVLPTGSSLSDVIDSIFGVTFFGSLLSGVLVVVFALPAYLVARRLGWARPGVALASGAALGALALGFINQSGKFGPTFLGAAIGGVSGWVFLRIAGDSGQDRPRRFPPCSG